MRVFLAISLSFLNISCSVLEFFVEPEIPNAAPEFVALGDRMLSAGTGLVREGVEYRIDADLLKSKTVTQDLYQDESALTQYILIDGEYVSALIIDHLPQFQRDNIALYGLEGMATRAFPEGEYRFEGTYQIISTQNPVVAGYEEEIEFDIHFQTGILRGGSLTGDDTKIRGVLCGYEVELRIEDLTGVHEGEGLFFGPEAEEFVGFYSAPEQSGAVYALQRLSDQLKRQN